ncbi:membrane protein [Beggiatoa sp. PS]|nr:membrane protein [Beggiatoa sp. PS]
MAIYALGSFFQYSTPTAYSGSAEAGHLAVSFVKSFQNWITLYKNEPLIYLNLVLLYLLIIPVIIRHKFSISSLFVTSVIFCNLYFVIVMIGNRTMHYELRYIYPIAPLLILNIVAFLLFIWNNSLLWTKVII